MKLSVIIPAHNAEAGLERVINSIIANNELEYEIIICENNSTDNTKQVAAEFAQRYEHIHVVYSEATSAGGALNDGLDIAQGEYIHFVDSDDEVFSSEYKAVINEIESKQADVLQVKYVVFDDSIKKYTFVRGHGAMNNSYWNKIYSHRFIKRYSIRFIADILSQDGNFNADIKRYLPKLVFSNELLYKYYVNMEGGSVSDNVRIKTARGFYFEQQKENYLISKGQIPAGHNRIHPYYRFLAYKTDDVDYKEAIDLYMEMAETFYLQMPLKLEQYKVNKHYGYVMYIALLNKDKEAVACLQNNHQKFLMNIGLPNQRDYLQVVSKNTSEIINMRKLEVIDNLVEIDNPNIRKQLLDVFYALNLIIPLSEKNQVKATKYIEAKKFKKLKKVVKWK